MQQVFRHGHFQHIFAGVQRVVGGFTGVESEGVFAKTSADLVFQSHKRTAADEKNFLGIHLDILLLGMLAPALWWHIADGSLKDFQQCLLHALTRDIPSNGNVFRLAADLVDFVHVNDPALGFGHVKIGCLQ